MCSHGLGIHVTAADVQRHAGKPDRRRRTVPAGRRGGRVGKPCSQSPAVALRRVADDRAINGGDLMEWAVHDKALPIGVRAVVSDERTSGERARVMNAAQHIAFNFAERSAADHWERPRKKGSSFVPSKGLARSIRSLATVGELSHFPKKWGALEGRSEAISHGASHSGVEANQHGLAGCGNG